MAELILLSARNKIKVLEKKEKQRLGQLPKQDQHK
jgi:hypothetical protein